MSKMFLIPLFDTYENTNDFINIRVRASEIIAYNDHVHSIGFGEFVEDCVGSKIHFKTMDSRCSALSVVELDEMFYDAEYEGATGIIIPRSVAAQESKNRLRQQYDDSFAQNVETLLGQRIY